MIKFKRTDFFPQKDIINIKSLNSLLSDNLKDFKLQNNFEIENVSSLVNIHENSIVFADELLDLKLSNFNLCILTNNKLNFNEKYKSIFLVKDLSRAYNTIINLLYHHEDCLSYSDTFENNNGSFISKY